MHTAGVEVSWDLARGERQRTDLEEEGSSKNSHILHCSRPTDDRGKCAGPATSPVSGTTASLKSLPRRTALSRAATTQPATRARVVKVAVRASLRQSTRPKPASTPCTPGGMLLQGVETPGLSSALANDRTNYRVDSEGGLFSFFICIERVGGVHTHRGTDHTDRPEDDGTNLQATICPSSRCKPRTCTLRRQRRRREASGMWANEGGC